MAKEKLPISVVIRTLNEEPNISDCIKACQENYPGEIIVVDGRSRDKTRGLAQKQGAKVVISERGLATQREAGIRASSLPYIAIVDADDRLKDDCLATLLKEMEEGNYDAIQAQIGNFYDWPGNKFKKKKARYWEKAMDVNLNIIRAKIGKTSMVGRPALYKADALKQIPLDSIFKDASEDSDLSYRFHLRGFKQAIGSGVSYRKHLSSFRAVVKKCISNGKGDATFVVRHPEKLLTVIKHELYTYPIKRSFKALLKGHLKYLPFFILVGLFRFIGFFMTMIKFAFKKIPIK